MAKVSVLMPVHNSAPFVEASVNSILAQTFADFELVIVNDGSIDRSGKILDELAGVDSRIRLIHLPHNIGIVGALNEGLAACRGQYIARVDADDLACADRLATQAAFLDEHADHVACGSDVLLFGAEYWYARYPRSSAECNSYLTLFPCFAHGAVMLRQSAMTKARYGNDYPFAEDYHLWTRIASLGKLANIPRPLMRYRVHAQQSSVAHQKAQRKSHCRIAAEMLASKGFCNIDSETIESFLWPRPDRFDHKRLAYVRHAWALLSRLGEMNDGHCRWLRRRMLKVAARNTLFFQ